MSSAANTSLRSQLSTLDDGVNKEENRLPKDAPQSTEDALKVRVPENQRGIRNAQSKSRASSASSPLPGNNHLARAITGSENTPMASGTEDLMLDASTIKHVSNFVDNLNGKQRKEGDETCNDVEESTGKFLAVLSNDDEELAKEFGQVVKQASEDQMDEIRPETLAAIGNYIDMAVTKNNRGTEKNSEARVLEDDALVQEAVAKFIDHAQEAKQRTSLAGSVDAITQGVAEPTSEEKSTNSSEASCFQTNSPFPTESACGTFSSSPLEKSEILEVLSSLAAYIDSARRRKEKDRSVDKRADESASQSNSASNPARYLPSSSSDSDLGSNEIQEVLEGLANYVDATHSADTSAAQASGLGSSSEDYRNNAVVILKSLAEYIDAAQIKRERRRAANRHHKNISLESGSVHSATARRLASGDGLDFRGSLADYIDAAQKRRKRRILKAKSNENDAVTLSKNSSAETDLDTMSSLRCNTEADSTTMHDAPLRSGLVSEDNSGSVYSTTNRFAAKLSRSENSSDQKFCSSVTGEEVAGQTEESEQAMDHCITEDFPEVSQLDSDTLATIRDYIDTVSVLANQESKDRGISSQQGQDSNSTSTNEAIDQDNPSGYAVIETRLSEDVHGLTEFDPETLATIGAFLDSVSLAEREKSPPPVTVLRHEDQKRGAKGSSSFADHTEDDSLPMSHSTVENEFSSSVNEGSADESKGDDVDERENGGKNSPHSTFGGVELSLSDDLPEVADFSPETLASIGAYIDSVSLSKPVSSGEAHLSEVEPSKPDGHEFQNVTNITSFENVPVDAVCKVGSVSPELDGQQVEGRVSSASSENVPADKLSRAESDSSETDAGELLEGVASSESFASGPAYTVPMDESVLSERCFQKGEGFGDSASLESSPIDMASTVERYIESIQSGQDDMSQRNGMLPDDFRLSLGVLVDAVSHENGRDSDELEEDIDAYSYRSVDIPESVRQDVKKFIGIIEAKQYLSNSDEVSCHSQDVPGRVRDAMGTFIDTLNLDDSQGQNVPLHLLHGFLKGCQKEKHLKREKAPDPPLQITQSEEERTLACEPEKNPSKSDADQRDVPCEESHLNSAPISVASDSIKNRAPSLSETLCPSALINPAEANEVTSIFEETNLGGASSDTNRISVETDATHPDVPTAKESVAVGAGKAAQDDAVGVSDANEEKKEEEEQEKKREHVEGEPEGQHVVDLTSILLGFGEHSARDRKKTRDLAVFAFPLLDGRKPSPSAVSQIMNKASDIDIPLSAADRIISLAETLIEDADDVDVDDPSGEIEMAPSDELFSAKGIKKNNVRPDAKPGDDVVDVFIRRLAHAGKADPRFAFVLSYSDKDENDSVDDIDIRFTQARCDAEAIELDILPGPENEEQEACESDEESTSVSKARSTERSGCQAIHDIDDFWSHQRQIRVKRFGYPAKTIAKNQRLAEEGSYNQKDFSWPTPSASLVSSSVSFESLENDWSRKQSMAKWKKSGMVDNLWKRRETAIDLDEPKEVNAVAVTARLLTSGPLRRSSRYTPPTEQWRRTYKDRTGDHAGFLGVHANSLANSASPTCGPHCLDNRPWEHRTVKQRFLHEASVSFRRNWFGVLVPVEGNQEVDEPICSVTSMPMPVRAGEWIEEWYSRPWAQPLEVSSSPRGAVIATSSRSFFAHMDNEIHDNLDDDDDDGVWEDVPECGRIRNVKLKIGERISRVTPDLTSSLRRSRWRKKHFPRGTFPY